MDAYLTKECRELYAELRGMEMPKRLEYISSYVVENANSGPQEGVHFAHLTAAALALLHMVRTKAFDSEKEALEAAKSGMDLVCGGNGYHWLVKNMDDAERLVKNVSRSYGGNFKEALASYVFPQIIHQAYGPKLNDMGITNVKIEPQVDIAKIKEHDVPRDFAPDEYEA